MAREGRKRIGELFASVLRIDPTGRDLWLRDACGDDEELRAAVVRLLDEAERAGRGPFLTVPDPPDRAREVTVSWRPQGESRPSSQERAPSDRRFAEDLVGKHGFSPKAVIASNPRPHPFSAAQSVVQARLRELPIIYILFLAMATFWRCVILGDNDQLLHYIDGSAIACLSGVVALLSSLGPLSLARLRVLELGVVGLFASRIAIVEYRLVLLFSRRGNPEMAQLTEKNIALLTAVMILTYGLYVPKTWRRAALLAGPLALLPYVTLLVLYLRHPAAMAWLRSGGREADYPRFLLFGFDAMTLLLVAVGSTIGARAVSQLRRQVAEARQLGQYNLRRRVGAGGMGEIYLAEHRLLKRPCALKLIHPCIDSDPKAQERFEREVRLTAALSHPNTVEVYDYGRTEDGVYYYVMEYLPGLNLAELVERFGPLPPGRVVYLLRQVCGALREAHAAGLIHRDIKPTNVFASRRGGSDDVAKLLDFGLVRPAPKPDDPRISGEGQVLGTPQFMSPEQAQGGRDLDGRSDIYSLGAVAYYLLTERPPFEGENGLRLVIAHARDPVIPPSTVRADIPNDLERIVLRCLAKDPAERFPDAASLSRALGKCACAGDWNEERAAHWWRDADRQVPPSEPRADRPAGGFAQDPSNSGSTP